MGIFSGIESVKVTTRGVYFQPGNYLVSVDRLKLFQDRNDIWCFAVECTALESDCPEIPVGTFCSHVYKKKFDSWLMQIKGFLAIAWGRDPEKLTEKDAIEATSENNPLMGHLVRVRAVAGKPVVGQKPPFPKVTWMPATSEDEKKYPMEVMEESTGNANIPF